MHTGGVASQAIAAKVAPPVEAPAPTPELTLNAANKPFSSEGAAKLALRKFGHGEVVPIAGGFAIKLQGAVGTTVSGIAGPGFNASSINLAQKNQGEQALDVVAHEAATSPSNNLPEPTQAQKDAGNYRKGHVWINGHHIAIENPAGSKRSPEWPPLQNHYGYIKGTVGKDKDHVDVFMTDRANDASLPVFVIDQNNTDGSFDEHKVVMGAATEQEARSTYLGNYSKDWNGLGDITQMTQDEVKDWVRNPSKTKRRAAKKSSTTQAEGATVTTTSKTQEQAVPTIDTSPTAPWRKSWGKAAEVATSLGLPTKDGQRNLKIPELAAAIEAKIAESKDGESHANPEIGPFGPILTQFKGDAQGAIKALTELQTGEAVAALNHPDVGDIDLVWGETSDNQRAKGFGLAKLMLWHPEILDDLQGFISRLTVKQRHNNKLHLQDEEGGRASIQLDWNGQRKTWLLTAYEKGTGKGKSADTAKITNGDDTALTGTSPARSLPPDAANGNADHSAPENAPNQAQDVLANEPSQDAPQSEWDAYNAAWDAHNKESGPYIHTGFKSIDQQRLEHAAERKAELDAIDKTIPISARRGITEVGYREFGRENGIYVDGGYGSDKQKDDGIALNNFRKIGSKKQLRRMDELLKEAKAKAKEYYAQNQPQALEQQAPVATENVADNAPPEFSSFEGKISLLQASEDFTLANGNLNERGHALASTPWSQPSEQDRSTVQKLSQNKKASNDAYNTYVTEEARQNERRRLQGDSIIQQSNGKPFKKESNAKAKLDEFNLSDTHAVSAVQGGFALRRMSESEASGLKRKASGRESYTEAQSAVLSDMGIGENPDGEIDATEEQWVEIEQRTNERLGRPQAQAQQPAQIGASQIWAGMQPTIDTSPTAPWRKSWGKAAEVATSLGLPTKDGQRNLKIPELAAAIEAKIAESKASESHANPEIGPFGPILTQFKGDAQGAIKALTELQTGEAVAALNHPDVGDIDLVWGKAPEGKNEGLGLAKLTIKHPEVLGNLQGFLDRLHKDNERSGPNRVRLTDASGEAVVSLNWKGDKKNWLLTAYEREAGAGTSMDIASNELKDDTARLEPSPSASLPGKAQAPIFESYADALAHIGNRAKELGIKEIAYRSTDEYKAFFPQIQALHEAAKAESNQTKAQNDAAKVKAMAEAGLAVRDRVKTTFRGMFMSADARTGTVVMRSGSPYVQMDAPITVSKNGKLSETSRMPWHNGWTKEGSAADSQNQQQTSAATAPTATDLVASKESIDLKAQLSRKPALKAASNSGWIITSHEGKGVWTNGVLIDLVSAPHIAGWDNEKHQDKARAALPPDAIERVLPKEKGSRLSPIKTSAKNNAAPKRVMTIFNMGGSLVGIDQAYVQYFVSKFGDVEFFSEADGKPVSAYQGNERVGIVMPLRHVAMFSNKENAESFIQENGLPLDYKAVKENGLYFVRGNQQQTKIAPKLSRSQAAPPPLTPATKVRAAITRAYGSLLTTLEQRGLVTLTQTQEQAIEAAAILRAEKTGEDVEAVKRTLMDSVAQSRSPMKSIEANIRRGLDSLTKALDEKTTVHRAMYRNGLGWVDFVWGSEGRVKPSGKTKGAMGLSHISEARQRKDEMTNNAVVGLMDDIVRAIATGTEFDRKELAGTVRVGVEHNDTVVWLTRRNGNNAWVVTAYEKSPGGANAGRATFAPTSTTASLTRDGHVAGLGQIMGLNNLDVKRSADGHVQGFFDPQTGHAFLIADNLTPEAAGPVLMHEVGIHMAANGAMKAVFNRANAMLKGNVGNPFFDRVQARMDAAGETSAEEAAAYITEEYERDTANAPNSVKRWLENLAATVRAWLHSKGFMDTDRLTAADIAAIARANAKSVARGDMGVAAGESGVAFSKAGTAADTEASEADHQYRETERAYGGKAAYDKAHAEGRTKLTYGQWVQVRTPKFKAWFGDWEALRALKRLDAMKPVKVRVPDDWRSLDTKSLRTRMEEALDAMVHERTEMIHPELGAIRVGRVGAKKSKSTANDPAKMLVAADLGPLIPAAIYARSTPPVEKEQGVDGYATLLMRVTIDGMPLVASFSIRQQRDGAWYYNAVALHDANEEARDSYGPSGALSRPLDEAPIAGLDSFVRRTLDRVNPNSISKAIDTKTGEPLVAYHATDSDIAVFDRKKLGSFTETNTDSKAAKRLAVAGFWFNEQPLAKAMGSRSDMPVFLRIVQPYKPRNVLGTMWAKAERGERIIPKNNDGVVVADDEFGNSTSFVATDPAQIKSAIGNNGNFDPASPDILFSRAAPPLEAIPTWSAPTITGFDTFLHKIQNKHIDTKRAQDAIEEFSGKLETPRQTKNQPSPAHKKLFSRHPLQKCLILQFESLSAPSRCRSFE